MTNESKRPSAPVGQGSVLVVGIYMIDRENTAVHVTNELRRSQRWRVDQYWLALGQGAIDPQLSGVTRGIVADRIPKFSLINRLLAEPRLDDYAYIVVSDDDVELPEHFLDDYLALVERHDFALAQPARTHDSYIDHRFVERLDGLRARQTNFVEIGPLFSIRRDAAPLILPFSEDSPMGWGYEFVWPCLLQPARLKLGIVDATPVAHRIRKPVAEYSHAVAASQMAEFLRTRRHLSPAEAFFILESYA